jgi:hypothetical protein
LVLFSSALEIENKQLKKVTDDLKNLILKLESRVASLEGGKTASAPASAPAKVVIWRLFTSWYQCSGSVTFLCGPGSADPCLRLMDPDPAIFVIYLQDANKKLVRKRFSAYYFLKVHLHQFSKIKAKRSHKTIGIKVFLNIFA